ncbi:MAG: hypothetical protein ABI114_11900 [Rhodanobacter sp.]
MCPFGSVVGLVLAQAGMAGWVLAQDAMVGFGMRLAGNYRSLAGVLRIFP